MWGLRSIYIFRIRIRIRFLDFDPELGIGFDTAVRATYPKNLGVENFRLGVFFFGIQEFTATGKNEPVPSEDPTSTWYQVHEKTLSLI